MSSSAPRGWETADRPVPLPRAVVGDVQDVDETTHTIAGKLTVGPDLLGRGRFGTVRPVTIPGMEVEAVLKIVLHDGTGMSADRIIHEVELSRQLDHPNIVQFFGCMQIPTGAALVYERIPGQTLLNLWRTKWLETGKLLPEKRIRPYVFQILQALHYLQSAGIVHRDIKSNNIMLANGAKTVKVIDFGLATDVRNGKAMVIRKFKHAFPPEMGVKSMGGIDHKVDIFMLGRMLYMITTDELPFGDLSKMKSTKQIDRMKLGAEQSSKQYKSLSRHFRNLIMSMMEFEPGHRPDAETALKHRWFKTRFHASPAVLTSHVHRKVPSSADNLDKVVLKRLAFRLGMSAKEIADIAFRDRHSWLAIVYNANSRSQPASLTAPEQKRSEGDVQCLAGSTTKCTLGGCRRTPALPGIAEQPETGDVDLQ